MEDPENVFLDQLREFARSLTAWSASPGPRSDGRGEFKDFSYIHKMALSGQVPVIYESYHQIDILRCYFAAELYSMFCQLAGECGVGVFGFNADGWAPPVDLSDAAPPPADDPTLRRFVAVLGAATWPPRLQIETPAGTAAAAENQTPIGPKEQWVSGSRNRICVRLGLAMSNHARLMEYEVIGSRALVNTKNSRSESSTGPYSTTSRQTGRNRHKRTSFKIVQSRIGTSSRIDTNIIYPIID